MKDGDDIRSLVVAVTDGCVVIAMVWVRLALAMLRDWQLRGGSDSAGSVGSECELRNKSVMEEVART